MLEAVLTFFLVIAVFASGNHGRNGNMAGVDIGLVLTMDILAGGVLTAQHESGPHVWPGTGNERFELHVAVLCRPAGWRGRRRVALRRVFLPTSSGRRLKRPVVKHSRR